MPSLSVFHPTPYASLNARIEALQPDAVRRWGRMDAAQMLAHVSVPLEQGLGKQQLPPEFAWPLNVVVKWFVLRQKQFKPDLPTAKAFVVADRREFEREKARLVANLREIRARGLEGGPWASHTLFGRLTNDQWGTLTYKHLDHHLRQFGV